MPGKNVELGILISIKNKNYFIKVSPFHSGRCNSAFYHTGMLLLLMVDAVVGTRTRYLVGVVCGV